MASGREPSRWLNTEPSPPAPHIVDCNLELLGPLGITSPTVRFELPETAEAREAAEQIIRRVNLESGYVLINPGAGWPSKLWPAKRFAAVAQHIARTWRLPSIVLWAGQQEQAIAHEVVAHSAMLAARPPAPGVGRASRRARLFVAADTDCPPGGRGGHALRRLFGPMPAERSYGPSIACKPSTLKAPAANAATPPRRHGSHHRRHGHCRLRSDPPTQSLALLDEVESGEWRVESSQLALHSLLHSPLTSGSRRSAVRRDRVQLVVVHLELAVDLEPFASGDDAVQQFDERGQIAKLFVEDFQLGRTIAVVLVDVVAVGCSSMW